VAGGTVTPREPQVEKGGPGHPARGLTPSTRSRGSVG
jgi:hypothetical protein